MPTSPASPRTTPEDFLVQPRLRHVGGHADAAKADAEGRLVLWAQPVARPHRLRHAVVREPPAFHIKELLPARARLDALGVQAAGVLGQGDPGRDDVERHGVGPAQDVGVRSVVGAAAKIIRDAADARAPTA